MMDNRNLILTMILVFLGLMIYQAWQDDYGPKPEEMPVSVTPGTDASGQSPSISATPEVPQPGEGKQAPDMPGATLFSQSSATGVKVITDVLELSLDAHGGDVRQALLPTYPLTAKTPDTPFPLMNDQLPHLYILQSGLLAKQPAPTHEALYQFEHSEYRLEEKAQQLEVPFTWNQEGIKVTKTYRFRPGSFVMDLEYRIENQSDTLWEGRPYAQFQRTNYTPGTSSKMMYTYLGGAISSPKMRYEKITLQEIEDDQLSKEHREPWHPGWLAMLQHYFVTAVIPNPDQSYHYYSKYLPANQRYVLGAWGPQITVNPGQQQTISMALYVGPKIQSTLSAVSPGLDLTVDYGYLWFIAQPLFWMLKAIHDLVGNWGWAIILLTILIKLAFYHLSATSYKSMANMRRMQPKLVELKERYANDSQGLNQAMMDLYRKEKINPLGGCLPILVQIPVFIALYWVLAESIELRHAGFMLWITDLSSPDPYFVLPLMMGVTMMIQQWLNPAPVDPVQQKVMMMLPIIFTVFFAFFPAGLVIYWVVNNVLSIAQQWQITKKYAGDTL